LLLLWYFQRSAAAPAWLEGTAIALAWAAVLITIYSGIAYVFAAIRLMRG
jgi:hypothetical protein